MNINYEDIDLLLLWALPISCENFKGDILYDRECTITLDEVYTALRSKEFSKLKYLKNDNKAKGLSFLNKRK